MFLIIEICWGFRFSVWDFNYDMDTYTALTALGSQSKISGSTEIYPINTGYMLDI